MTWDNLTFGGSLQVLQSLGALEPCWMVSGQPSLWDTVTPILNDVAMITDEKESSAVRHIDLHPNQAISVARQMMQSDALAEVEIPLVEGLPVEAQLQIMLEVNADVGSGRYRPEGRSQLSVVHPNFDILPVQELIKSSGVVKM